MTGSRLLWQIPWCTLELFMQAGRKIQCIDTPNSSAIQRLIKDQRTQPQQPVAELLMSWGSNETVWSAQQKKFEPRAPVERYQMMSAGWAMRIPGLWWVAWIPLPGSIISIISYIIIREFWVAWLAFVPQFLLKIPSDEPLFERKDKVRGTAQLVGLCFSALHSRTMCASIGEDTLPSSPIGILMHRPI